MPGDYSRKIFDPKKHYSGVLMQEGRVQLDADSNEQLDILQHRTFTETTDIIGSCGVRHGSDGFKISVTPGGTDFAISAGRMYVGGLMCELEDPGTSYTTQPYYPQPALTTRVANPPVNPPGSSWQLDLASGFYLVFIDAWQREITALDDPQIREVALGGPDTTTRLQTVWQVKLLPLSVSIPTSSPPADLSCQKPLDEYAGLTARKTGLMKARTRPAENQKDPCLLPPTAGYQGLENQLYRVQVHTGGNLNTATFKWSLNNACFESTIKNISSNIITVEETGKDEFLRFSGGQWVEIVDPETELNSSTRPLVQIASVDPNTGEIKMQTSVAALASLKNAKLRGWDQSGPSSNSNGVKMNLATWIDLKGGVQVSFSDGTYQAGDYWLIPARTATGDIEWPPPIEKPPVGIQHHFCKLALISVGRRTTLGTGMSVIADCRPLFPPLTKLTQLHYVSGDGQEGLPGQALPFPLQVGVANGSFPVANARVRFQVIGGTGSVISSTTSPPSVVVQTGADGSAASIVVQTGADGVAECTWQLDATTKKQRVEATLLDHTTLPVRFNATFQQAQTQPGIHITAVQLQSRELRNDTNVRPEELAGGISIICDEKINPASIIRPTCFVTLEMPFPFNSVDRELWSAPVIGFQPLILSADLGVREKTINWVPSSETIPFLQRLFEMMNKLQCGDRVLARLTLKGNFIWAATAPDLYLDGEGFGFQRPQIIVVQPGAPSTERLPGDSRIRPPLSSNIDIRLPSGNGWRGGDFEMWFWLKPTVSLPPNIQVTSLQLDFGTIPAGGVPNLTTRVSNIGAAPLTVSSMAIDHTASDQTAFQFITSTAPFTLAPGEHQDVTVQFRTTSPTLQNDTLKINSNDPNTPTVTVALVGPGAQILAPNIQVSPSALDFGNVTANGATLPLTVSNTGMARLDVGSITSNVSVFKVISPTGPFPIAAGGQQIVTVQFLPTAPGSQSGILTIPSNDPDQPTVSVIMTGSRISIPVTTPNIEITPPALDFGNVTANSVSLQLTVSNTGDAPLIVSEIVSNLPDFTVIRPTDIPGRGPFSFALDAGRSRIVNVQFTPTAPGLQSGTVVVTSNDTDRAKAKIPVTGTRLPPPAPNIAVDPSPLNFGDVTNNGANLKLIVRNTGNAPFEVVSITSSNPASFQVISPAGAFNVPASGQQEVNVHFSPSGVAGGAKQTADLTINSKDQPPVIVKVTGKLKAT